MNTRARNVAVAVLVMVLTVTHAQSGNGPINLDQRLEEMDSSTSLPQRRSNGYETILVVAGELSVYLDTTRGELREEVLSSYLPEEWPRYLAIVKRVYQAGDSFVVPTGQLFYFSNEGSAKVTFVTTFLRQGGTLVTLR